MSIEGQIRDKKSLRVVTGKTADFPELDKDCVAFANAQGGHLLIGIEDKAVLPTAEQAVNVVVLPSIVQAENGGEYIDMIAQRSQGVASTTDGRFFIRIADTRQPVLGDDAAVTTIHRT